MRRLGLIILLCAALVVLIPDSRSRAGYPGWQKELPHEIAHVSPSRDFAKVAIVQQNLVQIYNEKGEKVFEIKAPSPPTPFLSPDGNHVLIQVKGSQESLRNVYLYTTGGKLLWSKAGLPPNPFFSGDSRHILFSSLTNGGARLLDIKGTVLWKKEAQEIKPDLRAIHISDDGGKFLFNHTGIFDHTGKKTLTMDFGWYCDLSSDGSLVAHHETADNKVFLNLTDSLGNRKLRKMIVPSTKENPHAALAVSLNQAASRIAVVGNWKRKGYIRLLDLEGKEQWTKGGLPRFITGDPGAVQLTWRYVRVETFHDIRVYDLAGNLTWKGSKEYKYFMSDDGQYVIIKFPKKLYYLGPADYLKLGEMPAEVPSLESEETPPGPPEAVTTPVSPAPATGAVLPQGATGTILPQGTTGTIVLPGGATQPVPEGATTVVPAREAPFREEAFTANWVLILIIFFLILLVAGTMFVIIRLRGRKKDRTRKDPDVMEPPWEDEEE